jgi:steroid delta-isomerase-like uncharacterized protein
MAEENSKLTRRWFEEVWNKKRMATVDEMASPDIVGHGQAQHDTEIGIEQFKTLVHTMHGAFPDLEVIIDQTIEQGDKVAVRWTCTMTHKGTFLGFAPSGKKATITGTSIQRFSGGKIVEGWDNWDQLGLLVQIGAMPATHFVAPQERRSA